MLRVFRISERLHRDIPQRSTFLIVRSLSHVKGFHDETITKQTNHNNTQYYIGSELYSTSGEKENHVLICGDGDLSYSASVAEKLAQNNVKVFASVLESEEDHSRVYKNSKQNTRIIQDYGHDVLFSIDATNLKHTFDNQYFDRIQFNFPHWRGKTNNRYNRELISNFFESSSKVLAQNGQIHMALMDHQGAAYAKSLNDWKQSWMPARYAANNNLLLTHVLPFQPEYNLSSYQWRDRSFHSRRGKPFMYIFTNADGVTKAPCHLQLFSYFNFFVRLSKTSEYKGQDGSDTTGNVVIKLIQDLVPDGVTVDVQFVKLVDGASLRNPQECYEFEEYRVVLFGESRPMRQSFAQEIMNHIEKEIYSFTGWKRTGIWKASHPCPSSIFTSLTQIK